MFTSTYRTKKIEDSGVFVGTVNIFWRKRFVCTVEMESSAPDSLVLAYLSQKTFQTRADVNNNE